MVCPECGQRKARRACPALATQICAVCCGTKRLTRIACPDDCVYLAAARQHPPAAEQRRREQDTRVLAGLARDLDDRQARLLLILQLLTRDRQRLLVPAINDDDVAGAAASLAATIETEQRGIIFEQQPSSLQAQRLVTDYRAVIDRIRASAPSHVDRDLPAVLRAIERGARLARRDLPGGDRAYLDLLDRVFRDAPVGALTTTAGDWQEPEETTRSNLILP